MPLSARLLLIAALGLGSIVIACGGDGDDEASPTPTRTPTASRVTGTPTPDGGEDKTPGPDESPNGQGTPTPDGGPAPTRAPEGTPAVAPADQTAFLAQFQGRDEVRENCTYDPRIFVVDCPGRGKFAIDPPLQGQDVSCDIGIVDGNSEFINCRSQEPLQSIYYDIQ